MLKNIFITAGLLIGLSSLPAHSVPASSTPVAGANLGYAYQKPGDSKVYGYNTDVYFHPASTQKLLTGLSAILFLGPDFTLKTSVMVAESNVTKDGRLKLTEDGTLQGNVLIKFTGDPTLSSADYYALIGNLSKHGVKRINGSVILDLSRFGGRSRANGWSWDDLPVCFTAPAASVIINRNCVISALQPAGEGSVASPVADSSSPIKITSDAVAVLPKNYGGDCELQADLYMKNEYHMTGCVPIQKGNKAWPLSLSITDPDDWGVQWTKKAFANKHISIQKIVLSHDSGASSGYRAVAQYVSKPLSQLVKYMLWHSNNLYADAIAKNIAAEYYGRSATYYRALTAIKSILSKYADIDLGNAYLVDGSGLSPHNLITPHQMLNLLSYVNKNNDKLHFIELLPVAGESGTLRFRGSCNKPPLIHNVTAKTGTLQNVSNLAGFLTTKSGHRVPFVLFANALSYDQKTMDNLRFHRISNPNYRHERYLLESIYNELTAGRDFH